MDEIKCTPEKHVARVPDYFLEYPVKQIKVGLGPRGETLYDGPPILSRSLPFACECITTKLSIRITAQVDQRFQAAADAILKFNENLMSRDEFRALIEGEPQPPRPPQSGWRGADSGRGLFENLMDFFQHDSRRKS